MTPEEWRAAKDLLAEALELPADRRTAFLDSRCGDNPALRRELEALLAASDDDGFLDNEPRLPGPAIAAGEILGPYRVEKKLAEGGMGEVYQAFDDRLGRRVAIKVLPARLSRNASALLRFEREAKALAALSHLNILTIFDVGRHDGTAFAVTELLTGMTLRQRLDRGKLPIATAVDVAAQVARGLAVAHAAGIVHRDLKPENLFMTAGGPAGGIIKILDFGIAFTVPRPGLGSAPLRLTAEGSVIGTARYMSPEQARGEGCDHRSDIFSLGAVLYEMLTGSQAFPGDTLWRATDFIWGLRVAPAGDAVAFCTYAGLLQSIVIVDRAGKIVTRSDGWRLPSLREGLSSGCVSWAPGGKDLWFVAARGSDAGLHALTRAGKVRPLYRFPGSLALLDTARDGRVLLAQANQRNWIMARPPGAMNERDLSWFDSSELADLSADGRWALARSATNTRRLFLLPTGAGEPRDLPSVSVDVFAAKWLPDGKRLIVYATEPGKGDRLYVMGLGAKELHPLTPWGSSWNWAASPDGSQVATFGLDGVKVYPISGGAPRTVPGVPPVGEVPIQWRAGGRSLYMGHVGFFGSRRYEIDEVDITTGKRVPWKELRLTDPAGAEVVYAMMTPGGEAYAYSARSSLSTLYLVEGLR